MGPLLQVGEDEPLPVPVQQVLRAVGVEDQALALFQGFQEQVDLGIVAEGLKVANTLHGVSDGLLVQDAALIHLYLHVEPFGNEALEDFDLDLAHEPGVDLPGPLVPEDGEHGVLLLQEPELGEHHLGVAALGQHQPVGEDGL